MKDVHSRMKRVVMIGSAIRLADFVGAIVDRQGFEGVEIELDIGIGGITFDPTNKIEFRMDHGDDPALSDAVAVTQADMLGVTVGANGIIKALTAAHAAAAAYRAGYRGAKRYFRVTEDFSGTHGAGTPASVTALLSEPALAPVPNQP